VDQALATKGYRPLLTPWELIRFVINYVLGEPQKNEKEVLIRAADYIADQLCFQQNINSFNSNENN